MNKIIADGDEIINLLRGLCELDWAKNSLSRVVFTTPGGTTNEDRSAEPPYTSFRLRGDRPGFLEALSDAVSSYRGAIDWVLISHERTPLPGVNWTLCPKLTVDLDAEVKASGLPVQQYFRERVPGFGAQAYADMLPLVDFLASRLSPQSKGRAGEQESS